MGPLLAILDTYLRKTSSLLELGCGDGALISSIARNKTYSLSRITAVDFYNAPASLPANVEFIKQDLEQFNVKGPFDLVILNQVFEHIKNPAGLIEELKAQLSEHGKIVIVVPNRRGFGNEARVYLPEHGKHYFLWDRESLEYTLNRLGFICRFHARYAGASWKGLLKYVPALLRWESPHLVCVAMKDVS